MWLGTNWAKLVETVQTLATKYGQEHKQNTTGAISAREARAALVKHKGNVWHSVTECIEQRERAFNAIGDQGGFSRADIVTHLTHHQGDVEATLNELNQLQLRPFLLKVFGSQVGGVNGPVIDAQLQGEQENHLKDSIQQSDEERANILRDIEKIISNLEAKQSKQTETVLQTIETYFENMTRRSNSASRTPRSSAASLEQINIKSSFSPAAEPVVPNDSKNTRNARQEIADGHDEASNGQREPSENGRGAPKLIQSDYESRSIGASMDYGGSIIELILEEPSERETSVDSEQANTSASPTITLSNESTANESSLSPTPLSTRTPSRLSMKYRGPKFSIHRGFSKVSTARLNDKRKIRELERELKRQMQVASLKAQESRPESQMTGFISDSTLVADDDRSLITPIPPNPPNNDEVRTFSMQITQQSSLEALDVDQSTRPADFQQPSTSKDAKNRNLSDMVQDTKQLIQQMKNEIDEDIAMSDFGGEDDENDDSVYFEHNGEYFENADYEEDLSEETINENDFDSSDGWIDIEDDEEGDDEENDGEVIYENLRSNNGSRRSSVESDQFVEAHEELTPSMMQNDSIDLDDADNISLEHFDLNDETSEVEESTEAAGGSRMDTLDEIHAIETDTSQSITPNDLLNNAPPVDSEEYMENALEIQRSLHSSVIALNVVEISAEEESRESTVEAHGAEEEQEELPAIEGVADSQIENYSNEPVENAALEPDEAPAAPQDVPELDLVSSDLVEFNVEDGTVATDVAEETESNMQEENMENRATEGSPPEEIVEARFEIQVSAVPEAAELHHSVREDAVSIATEMYSSSDATSDTVILVPDSVRIENSDEEQEETEEEVSEISEEMSQSEELSESVPTAKIEASESVETASNNHIGEAQAAESSDQAETLSAAPPESAGANQHNSTPEATSSAQGDDVIAQSASSETLVESFKYEKITIPVITECNQTSINLLQLKKNDNLSPNRNKIPVRRLSLTGASSSVRQLQSELLSRQSSPPKQKPIARRPSKIVPPKLFFREGVASEPTPSTSKQATSTRELPKKKYYETCFSDDYQTSDDEKPPPTSLRTIPNLVQITENSEDSKDPEVIMKRLLDEGTLSNEYDALLVLDLLQLNFDQKSALSVVGQCSTVEQAVAFLQQECELCTETYPMNKIVSMLKCTHSCCVECAKNYFTIQVSASSELFFPFLLERLLSQITDRSIADCSCPFCKMPDLNVSDITEDDVLEYFSNLDILLKNILEESVHELFQRKLRDRTLLQDPNFKWCVQVISRKLKSRKCVLG